jgi:hypothetical protein
MKLWLTAALIGGSFALPTAIASNADEAPSCLSPEGNWVLEEEGISGPALSLNPYFEISSIALTTRVNNAQVAQDWIFIGPHLNRTAHYVFSVEGNLENTGVKSPMDFEYTAISAQWQNCTLIQSGYSQLFGLTVQTTNTYVLSPDGTRLTILQYGESPISVLDRRLVFKRQ